MGEYNKIDVFSLKKDFFVNLNESNLETEMGSFLLSDPIFLFLNIFSAQIKSVRQEGGSKSRKLVSSEQTSYFEQYSHVALRGVNVVEQRLDGHPLHRNTTLKKTTFFSFLLKTLLINQI